MLIEHSTIYNQVLHIKDMQTTLYSLDTFLISNLVLKTRKPRFLSLLSRPDKYDEVLLNNLKISVRQYSIAISFIMKSSWLYNKVLVDNLKQVEKICQHFLPMKHTSSFNLKPDFETPLM